MWKKSKGGLWVIADEKTADRPHPITVWLALFSPCLALVAIWISYSVLQTSERAMKISNRAYLALSNGQLSFTNYGFVNQLQKDGPLGGAFVRMDLTATIHNAGNSPAFVGHFTPSYRLPPEWSVADRSFRNNLRGSAISVIGPKSEVQWIYTELFKLTPDQHHAFRENPGQVVIDVKGDLEFKDAFGDVGHVSWCWSALTNERQTKVSDCGDIMRPILDAFHLPFQKDR